MRSENAQNYGKKEKDTEKHLLTIFNKFGILHQRTCVETPQRNSVVERKHQHILNITRNLMIQFGLPKAYWSYVVSYVVYIINRLPSTVINYKTPYELLYKTPPTYLNLRIFGSLCFASTLENNRTKLEPRARKCVFFGFKTGIKGYVLLDTNNINFYK